jgi:hypothetical protein
VVPVLVRDDVGTGERAAFGAEAGLQLLEERQVDVDLVVRRTVERPDGRGCVSAPGTDAAAEEVRARRAVRDARTRERVAPVAVERVDDGNDLAVQLRVGLLAGAAARRRRRRVGRLAGGQLGETAGKAQPARAAELR